MNFLQNLFSNDKMKDLALGMLKKTMIENKIKYVVIDMAENETLDLKMFPADMQPCIMGAAQLTQIDQVLVDQETKLKDLERQIEAYQETVTNLVGQIDKLTAENEALYVPDSITSETPIDGSINTTP